MAYYNKIGLLVLNNDATAFLVCEPGSNYDTPATQYLMPGGQLEEESEIDCLQREIQEELAVGVKPESVEYIGQYTDVSASHPNRDVMIRLYSGELDGQPVASNEIGALHWIGVADADSPKVSSIIKNKIIPDLVQRNILKAS